MKRVLLTSFEPFGGQAVNSSQEVARVVSQSPPPGVELRWLSLPVTAGVCVEQAWAVVEAWRPELVLALGQAGSSPRVRLEDRASNFDHFHFPDNGGQLRELCAIVPDGPAVLRTRVSVPTLLSQMSDHPVEPSFSAGSFVCNHLYYHLLYRAERMPAARILFVHLPLLPEQRLPNAPTFAMPLAAQVACVLHLVGASC